MEFGEWLGCGQLCVASAAGVKIEAITAATPLGAWLAAFVHAAPGLQITDSKELLLWMLAGVLCGAATAVLFPSTHTKTSITRRFFGSTVGGAGLTLTVFVAGIIAPNADRMLAGGWIGGLMAWPLIPMLSKDGRTIAAKWFRAWLQRMLGSNGNG